MSSEKKHPGFATQESQDFQGPTVIVDESALVDVEKKSLKPISRSPSTTSSISPPNQSSNTSVASADSHKTPIQCFVRIPIPSDNQDVKYDYDAVLKNLARGWRDRGDIKFEVNPNDHNVTEGLSYKRAKSRTNSDSTTNFQDKKITLSTSEEDAEAANLAFTQAMDVFIRSKILKVPLNTSLTAAQITRYNQARAMIISRGSHLTKSMRYYENELMCWFMQQSEDTSLYLKGYKNDPTGNTTFISCNQQGEMVTKIDTTRPITTNPNFNVTKEESDPGVVSEAKIFILETEETAVGVVTIFGDELPNSYPNALKQTPGWIEIANPTLARLLEEFAQCAPNYFASFVTFIQGNGFSPLLTTPLDNAYASLSPQEKAAAREPLLNILGQTWNKLSSWEKFKAKWQEIPRWKKLLVAFFVLLGIAAIVAGAFFPPSLAVTIPIISKTLAMSAATSALSLIFTGAAMFLITLIVHLKQIYNALNYHKKFIQQHPIEREVQSYSAAKTESSSPTPPQASPSFTPTLTSLAQPAAFVMTSATNTPSSSTQQIIQHTHGSDNQNQSVTTSLVIESYNLPQLSKTPPPISHIHQAPPTQSHLNEQNTHLKRSASF